MSSHIEQKGNTMFKQSANAVRTDLEALLLTTQSQINEGPRDATDEKRNLWGCIDSLASGVKHGFKPLAPLVAHFYLYIKPQDCNADLYVLRNVFRLMLILIPSILQRNKRRPRMGKAFRVFEKPSTLCSVCTMTSFMRMMWSLFNKQPKSALRGLRFVQSFKFDPTCPHNSKLRGYWPDLRPEEAAEEAHPNPNRSKGSTESLLIGTAPPEFNALTRTTLAFEFFPSTMQRERAARSTSFNQHKDETYKLFRDWKTEVEN